MSRETEKKRRAAVDAYLKDQTDDGWRELSKNVQALNRHDPAKFFREKHGENPPNLTDDELKELKAKTFWVSERSENYDSDTIDYYRKLGR